jgi:hypothetical protein
MRRNSLMSTPTYWPTCAISARSSSTLSADFSTKRLPAAAGLRRHAVEPVGVELVAAVVVDEFAAVDARLVGELHHG